MSAVNEKYKLYLDDQKTQENTFICIPNVNGNHTNIEECKQSEEY